MAVISAFTIIRAVSLFHITAAYFFLTAPKVILEQNVVLMLGASMRLPEATGLDKVNGATTFIAIIMAFLGISDLTAALNEEASVDHWLSIVPVRLLFLFLVTGYSWVFSENGALGSISLGKYSIGEPLQNGLVFTFGFLEIAVWFWAFTSLREERREMARKRLRQLQAEQDTL